MGKRNRRRIREAKETPSPEGMIADVPFDAAEFMGYGEPTYGGKKMPNPLPTLDEYMRAYWKLNGPPL